MDYKEEIKKAAEEYILSHKQWSKMMRKFYIKILTEFSTSNAVKEYWYNEFKRQKIQSDSGQDQTLRNQPLKPSECFHGKSEHKSVFSPELIKKLKERGEELKNESVQHIAKIFRDTIKEEYPEALEDMRKEIQEYSHYLDYIKEHPDRPISFDNWKYMVEHYNPLLTEGAMEGDVDAQLQQKWIDKDELDCAMRINGKHPHYPYGTIQSDPLYGATRKDFDDATPKRIGIIGHVDHGKSITGKIIIVGETGVDDRMVESAHNIQSIVPISDIMPDKDFILTYHDNAIEATILREKHEMDKPWNVNKQKKENHKRNNKRK